MFGRSQADFWTDVPDGPAQCVVTRLKLNLGEWFLDLRDGTGWYTQVLGVNTAPLRDPMLRARILGTQGITELVSYASQVDRNSRAYSVQATITTQYSGNPIPVNTQLTLQAQGSQGILVGNLLTQSSDRLTTQSGDHLVAQR